MTKTYSMLRFSPLLERIFMLALLGLGTAAPMVVHAAGGNGRVLLPIFFALSLGAAGLTALPMFFLALAVPLLNSLLFGMPSGPILYALLGESLVFMGLILLGRKVRLPFYPLSAAAFLGARLAGGLLAPWGIGFALWQANFAAGLPGLGVNILLSWALYFCVGRGQ